MRKALNENTTVQLAVVGALLAIGALFLLMRGGGGSSPPASSPAPNAAANVSGAAPTRTSSPTANAAAPLVDFAPGPGLPKRVFAAYQSDRVVVLLIARRGSVDDRLVRSSVLALRGEPDVSVFAVRARHASRYAAITEGLGVDRVPALVVLKPRRLSGGSPQGEVHYAFRSAASVRQAVRDAQYHGSERHAFDP